MRTLAERPPPADCETYPTTGPKRSIAHRGGQHACVEASVAKPRVRRSRGSLEQHGLRGPTSGAQSGLGLSRSIGRPRAQYGECAPLVELPRAFAMGTEELVELVGEHVVHMLDHPPRGIDALLCTLEGDRIATKAEV